MKFSGDDEIERNFGIGFFQKGPNSVRPYPCYSGELAPAYEEARIIHFRDTASFFKD